MSPPSTGVPAGSVRPLAGDAQAAVFDAETGSLAVLSPRPADRSVITPFAAAGDAASVPLPGPATAMTGDGEGRVFVSTRGGYFRVDLAGGAVTRVGVDGQEETDFTAIARRADGRLVLGSADGTVFTLSSDTAVGARLKIFARVDDLVTQGNTAVVLDRGQTSVTALERGRHRGRTCTARRRGGHHDGRRRRAGCWSPIPAAASCWCSAWTR